MPPLLRVYLKMGWDMESWAALMHRVNPATYMYYFKHSGPDGRIPFHTAEISYAFGLEKGAPRYSTNMPAPLARPQDIALSDMMADFWTNFAKTGSPNADGLPVWSGYGAKGTRSVMEFEAGKAVMNHEFFPQMQFKPVCDVQPVGRPSLT